MKNIAFAFTNTETSLDSLKESKVYKIKNKLINGEKITREEKDYITREIKSSLYGRNYIGVSLMGWMFTFRHFMKRYIVKQYNSWYEVYGFDKTSVKFAQGKGITEIYEIPNK